MQGIVFCAFYKVLIINLLPPPQLNSDRGHSWQGECPRLPIVETIVVNDGSTDGTALVVERYISEHVDTTVRLLSTTNGGQSSARNIGIGQARGRYLYFCDADDYLLPGTLKPLLGALQTGQWDLIGVGTCVKTLDKARADETLDYSAETTESEPQFRALDRDTLLEGYMWPGEQLTAYGPWAWVWSRATIGNQRFNTQVKMMEDGCFLLDGLQKAHRIGYMDKLTYVYVTVPDSVSHRERTFDDSFAIGMATALELRRIYNSYSPELRENAAVKAHLRTLVDYYVFMYCLWKAIKNKTGSRRRKESIKVLRQAGLYPIGAQHPVGQNVLYSRRLSLLWGLSRRPRLWNMACAVLNMRP